MNIDLKGSNLVSNGETTFVWWDSSDDIKNGLSGGEIAGIAVGCVVFAVLVGVAVLFGVKRCRVKK